MKRCETSPNKGSMKKVAIVGAVGVPANYGGFETLAENLVKYHHEHSTPFILTVYCSSKCYPIKTSNYLSSTLKYLPLQANGIQSIPYDICSLFWAVINRSDVILVLGVSGTVALPLVRLFSSARIIVNIDGLEWKREKWSGWARRFLRFSEKMAVCFAHEVITDNEGIADYVREKYSVKSQVIAYGGDQSALMVASREESLAETYAFAVCRIEPENNIHIIVEAFSKLNSQALVVVGNWDHCSYGREIRQRYKDYPNLHLFDPIYDLGKLNFLRSRASFYVHGHSAGGTNPSLVEAMHFGKPVLAYDCVYNRYTTENKAIFFQDVPSLCLLIASMVDSDQEKIGSAMKEIAKRRYTWESVAKQYFSLFDK